MYRVVATGGHIVAYFMFGPKEFTIEVIIVAFSCDSNTDAIPHFFFEFA